MAAYGHVSDINMMRRWAQRNVVKGLHTKVHTWPGPSMVILSSMGMLGVGVRKLTGTSRGTGGGGWC